MKTKVSIITLLLVIVLTSFSFFSCSKYFSSYFAIGLVKSAWGNQCSTTFYKLDGTLVFEISNKNDGEGCIHFKANLEEGEINVYYATPFFDKQLLFSLNGEQSTENDGGYVEGPGKVYIIIEARGAVKGSISVHV